MFGDVEDFDTINLRVLNKPHVAAGNLMKSYSPNSGTTLDIFLFSEKMNSAVAGLALKHLHRAISIQVCYEV